ncbi:hypothetical protein [Rhizobium leguminosarum]|uniref:hypothetical protein n=1 Tax=Rhizobium leguminosarum TaxID=384 RepID=UPI0014420151|nr:hypothetical protein [Rhizobium leguminosarum]NKJ77754.1 hypothetical protein [Rhizobium leguminosarum bv. viciae]
MVGNVRSAEDHNGDGLGIPPFPRKYTELTRTSFSVSGSDLVATHELHKDTSVVIFNFAPSGASVRFYVPANDGFSRVLPDKLWPHSVLDDSKRAVPLKIIGHDASSTFTIDIWEY